MKRCVWIVLAVLLAVNFLVLFAQNVVSVWQWRHLGPASWLLPESRYYLQGFVLFLPLVPMVALRFRHGKKLLVVLLVALVAHAAGFLAKAHVPGARRHQYVEACDWAVETIRTDYKGPEADAEPFFSWQEYHPLRRPCVDAHSPRVPYLLNGRSAAIVGCGLADIPDYIVDEPHKVNRDWWQFAKYEKIDGRKFGKRDFVIYKRVE